MIGSVINARSWRPNTVINDNFRAISPTEGTRRLSSQMSISKSSALRVLEVSLGTSKHNFFLEKNPQEKKKSESRILKVISY